MKMVQEYLRLAEVCRKFALETEVPGHRRKIEIISGHVAEARSGSAGISKKPHRKAPHKRGPYLGRREGERLLYAGKAILPVSYGPAWNRSQSTNPPDAALT